MSVLAAAVVAAIDMVVVMAAAAATVSPGCAALPTARHLRGSSVAGAGAVADPCPGRQELQTLSHACPRLIGLID